jgi:hypothetical protein
VSFLLIAVVSAVASGAAGALFARRRRKGDATPKVAAPAGAPALPSPSVPANVALAVGDVVAVLADGPGLGGVDGTSRERWLSSAVVAREADEVVAVVFFAPEGAREESVVAFPAPRRELGWMSATPTEIGKEPPTTIELGGVILDRRARRPVSLERLGRGAPRIGEHATYAEYASGRDFGVVLVGTEGVVSLRGVRLDAGEWEKMGSGESK